HRNGQDAALPRRDGPPAAAGARPTAGPHNIGTGARRLGAGVRRRGGRARGNAARDRGPMARPHGYRRHQRVREAAAPRYAPAPPPSGVAGILLDSDVVIEALRGRREISDRIRAIERRGVPTYCCAVSFAEIWAGVRPGEEAVTEAFFHARGEVVLDGVVGRRAGAYLSRDSRSHGVQIADALDAAAARPASSVADTRGSFPARSPRRRGRGRAPGEGCC